MAMSISSIDIKKDMEELVAIINEECIARPKIQRISDYSLIGMDKNKRLEAIRDYIKKEEDIAYITGLKGYKIPDRFVDKIIDIVQKYETEELKMLFRCTFLVLNDIESKNLRL